MHLISISSGELVDRLIILQLKYKTAPDDAREGIIRTVNELEDIYQNQPRAHKGLDARKQQLERINQTLWLLKDDIRNEGVTDKSHVAQQIAVVNDIRSTIKRDVPGFQANQAQCRAHDDTEK